MMDELKKQNTDVPASNESGQATLNETAIASFEEPLAAELTGLPHEQSESGTPDKPLKKGLSGVLVRFKKRKADELDTRPVARPIRLIIGYLPEVSRRDAIEFAQGIASKYFDQQGLTYYGAFEHDNGFIYEVQEGGDGRGYAPAIAEYFSTLGPFDSQRVDCVVIATATRKAQVQRQREGLSCILLPQSSAVEPTDWLVPSLPLEPALNRRTLFFKVGCFMLASGLAAMVSTGFFFRLQDFEPPPEVKPEVISAATLPRSQWARIASLPSNTYVKSLRYKNGRWEAPEVAVEAVPSSTSEAIAAPKNN